MPFELKNAPSAFQNAMIRVFEPILNNTLVYIDVLVPRGGLQVLGELDQQDDILLFSPDKKSHVDLLSKFHFIVQEYRIMLSEKKMEISVTPINFLGMNISNGKYQPRTHIAQELHKFPDELTTPREIQQFLSLVNYMADFLPKLSAHTVHVFLMLKKNPPTLVRDTDISRQSYKEIS
ncbi:hypothetical protein OSB04_031111 [Centaurea solstitialis]|uniref:Reverse transcriptase domain-containing protein n=1 Tax=Centaurea solstitialis TaxID=347529 RepID=A0AA38S9Q5_9ASTR|nr:hypothetical protein OSB04_031111 [Centaurea solstitialis]